MVQPRSHAAAVCAGFLAMACVGELDGDINRFIVFKEAAEGGDAPVSSSNCFDVPADLFAERCGGSVCHGASSSQDLDLESAGLVDRIAAQTGTGECEGQPILDPGAPAQSLLYLKLTDNPPCGEPMPYGAFGSSLLNDEELACVLEWITDSVGGSPPPGDGGSPVPVPEAGNPPIPMPEAAPPVVDPGPVEPPVVAVPPRSSWTTSASHSSTEPPNLAVDGDIATRWSSGKLQAGDEWFEIDLGAAATVTEIVLDHGESTEDFPQGYSVRTGVSPDQFGAPIASGAGSSGTTTISFAATTARFLRIEQTGTSDMWWSIHEVEVR